MGLFPSKTQTQRTTSDHTSAKLETILDNFYRPIIPETITTLILSYYYPKICFDRSPRYLVNVEYGKGNKSAKTARFNRGFGTCVLQEAITDEYCYRFSIQIATKGKRECIENISMGYVHDTSKKLTCDPLGIGGNRRNSVSIYLSKCWNKFYLYDKNHRYSEIRGNKMDQWKNDDTFTMSFNFEWNRLDLYHNEEYVASISLNGYKSVIPAFNLCGACDEISIKNFEFF